MKKSLLRHHSLLFYCFLYPKASTSATTAGTSTSTAEQIAQGKTFLKILAEDAINCRIQPLIILYNG
jgi:hypothetical protein